jgi:hypothetical protein
MKLSVKETIKFCFANVVGSVMDDIRTIAYFLAASNPLLSSLILLPSLIKAAPAKDEEWRTFGVSTSDKRGIAGNNPIPDPAREDDLLNVFKVYTRICMENVGHAIAFFSHHGTTTAFINPVDPHKNGILYISKTGPIEKLNISSLQPIVSRLEEDCFSNIFPYGSGFKIAYMLIHYLPFTLRLCANYNELKNAAGDLFDAHVGHDLHVPDSSHLFNMTLCEHVRRLSGDSDISV